MYRAQKVHKKNEVFRLVMCTPKVIVIKMSKMAHFTYFPLNIENNRPSLCKIFKCI